MSAFEFSFTHRITLLIFLWVNVETGCTTGSHRLIAVFSEMKDLLLFVIMYALDNFRPDKRTLGNDAFERHHLVEM